MTEETSTELLPVLVANLADEGARDFLQGVALAGGTAHLPLVEPPAERTPHVLEVSTPRSREPLVLIAEPLGPASGGLYPLRLRMVSRKRSVETRIPSSTRRATIAYADGRSPPPLPSRAPSSPALGSRAPSPPESQRIPSPPPSAPAKRPSSVPTQELSEPLPPASEPPPVSRRAEGLIGRELAGGKLVIEQRVGKGGAGTVFRARHRDLHMHVAVKVMNEEFQQDAAFCQRFQAEALSASRLDHPNLTRVLDYGQEPDGLLYIAMEFLDGVSLRDLLDHEKRLDLRRAINIMIQVCSGLTHAHARNIVHRDIKPENLVLVKGLDDDGRETTLVKVCDFGIAHGATSNAKAVFAGTPEYMSPEQCAGEDPDIQSDVYACGVVLFEMLTGVVPITGDTVTQILMRARTVEPDPPSSIVPGLDPRIDRIVLKALAKDRDVRHLNVRELRQELRAVMDDIALYASGYFRAAEAPTAPATHITLPAKGATPAPPPAASNPENDWLEHGPRYIESIMPGAMAPQSARPATSIVPGVSPSSPPQDKSEAAKLVAPFLRQLAETTDPTKFASIIAPLAEKVRALVAEGQIATVWKLRTTLDLIKDEKPGSAGASRVAQAAKLLELFSDPSLLAPIAERALDGIADKDNSAAKLILRAGTTGAHSLYTARLKSAVFETRERFVAILKEMGAPASPLVHAGLERLESRLAMPGAVGLVEDLLKAVPPKPDDAMGQILARYARCNVASIAQLSTAALPAVWGPRSRALLVWLVTHQEDAVAIAAIEGLRKLAAPDEAIVRKLEPLILGTAGSRMPVRVAAVEALKDTAPSALPAARQLLAQALAATTGTTPDVEDFIVVICRTILAIGGDGGLVAQRWKESKTWLRARLETLLREQGQRR
jgi:serine/threonine-protein kinase